MIRRSILISALALVACSDKANVVSPSANDTPAEAGGGSHGVAGGGHGPSSGGGNAGSGGDAATTCDDAAQLQAVLETQVAQLGVPGAAARVERVDCFWEGAAGTSDLEQTTPMPTAPAYRIGSTTKTLVAAALLVEVSAGNVSLETSIDAFVPAFPNASLISLRQVLNHTSGIFSYTDSDAFWDAIDAEPGRSWLPQELLDIAASEGSERAPGAGWSYSNTNYIVAGIALEAVTGEPIATAIRNRIVTPLGLTETWFDGEEPAVGTLVPGFDPYGGALYDVTNYVDISTAWAAGAVASTNRDVARFMQAVLDGELFGGIELAAMREFIPLGDGWGYGLGLLEVPVDGGNAYGHGGDILGYSSDIRYYPEQGVNIAHFVTAMNPTARDALSDALQTAALLP